MLRVAVQQWCVRLHEALSYVRASGRNTVNNVGSCSQKFDRFQTLRNNSQQHAIICNRVCIRTQSVTFNNVGSCWPTMLRPFARTSCMSWIKSVAGTILKTLNQCPWYASIRILSQFNKCLLLFKSASFKMTKFDKNWCNSFRFCFRIWICQSRWGLSNESPNLHKKTMNLRIVVVVVKLHHHAIVLLSVVQSFSRS